MPIDPRISLGVQPLQVADPMARYSQLAGIQNAQNQNALAQYQLSAAQRADEQQNKLYAAAQQPDFKLDFQSAIQYGAPGIAAYKAQQEASNAQTEGQIKSTKLLTDKLSLLPEAYKRADTPEAYLALHQSIHADPVLGPWLKSTGATPEKGLTTLQNAIQTGNFEKLRMGSMQSVSQILDSMKPTVVPASSSVYNPDTKTFTQAPAAPEKPPTQTELVRNFEFAKTPAGGNYRGSFADFKAISTPKTSVTVSTEKKYSEQFANKMADTDIAKMATAEQAPRLAESANRIIDLVQQGNIFTGPVADIKLNIARALNVAGASNEEKIANTESLIAATGQSTLDAIKSAGLGTGQGFTDKDLNFLRGIAGGTIQLTAQTLTELARLQHQTATRSAESWNTRVKQLPKSATEGTGLSLEPIKVPPLSSVTKGAARPAGVGANWTFESDAAGNKAWVSPDRKSFKEVK